MDQFEPPEGMKVSVDYTDDKLPVSVRALKPVVFQDGDSFCCLLGPDLQAGVFGCGASAKEAITDWDIHLKERIKDPIENDEVTQYIKEAFSIIDGG